MALSIARVVFDGMAMYRLRAASTFGVCFGALGGFRDLDAGTLWGIC
jgi:hypothetical protein